MYTSDPPRLRTSHHHHQPINVPTAGAQAFLMDYPQGERARAISHECNADIKVFLYHNL
jgi:hypothetical protein